MKKIKEVNQKANNEPKGAYTLIYRDETKIKNNVNNINKFVKIFNENYKRVKEINPFLSERITFLHTFFRYDNKSSSIIKKEIKDELFKCLQSENPYNNNEMVNELARELINKLHFNYEGEMINGCKQLSKEGVNGNLKTISINQKPFCERFISFDVDKDEFIINENACLKMMDDLSYYCQNSKQEKAVKLLNEINKNLTELKELGLRNIGNLGVGGIGEYPSKYLKNILSLTQNWHKIRKLK